jgi:sensor histidine kinase regulating citrate/malate metabolism
LLINAFIHVGISYAGLLYAKSEILLDGNDQVLNGLEEGLFVIDETKGKIRFINDAANIILKNDYLNSNAR